MKALLKNNWHSLVFFFALIIVVQTFGNLMTMPNIQPWYNSLNHPFWRPPNWVFGPVWTILYVMLAIVGWRLWISFDGSIGRKLKQPVIIFYFLQLFFNFLWSPLFFGLHWIDTAVLDLILIILFTIALLKRTFPINRACGYALIPYLLWLSYALSLNAALQYLN